MASCRSASRVVPAWSATPGKSSRHRPCGQMSVPRATGWSRSISPRPCSTCSSTKAPTRRSVSGSGPSSSGSRPAERRASAMVTPSLSRRPSARSDARAPVITREPAQATPNRAPSSSQKFDDAEGPLRLEAVVAQRSSAAKALTTPSGPSYAPPSGTLSRCEPVTTPGVVSGSPHHAHWLPIRSGGQVQSAADGLAGEPLPQIVVFARQGVPAVAAGLRVATDRRRARPTADRTRRRLGGHVPSRCADRALSRMGTRTPRSAATSTAES